MGIISSRSIKTFMARKRDDFTWLKKQTKRELNTMMHELPVRPPIWKRLAMHQRVMFLLGANMRRWCFFADTGMGKTFLSLALIRYFKRAKVARKFIVLVPNRSNKIEWQLQLDKHAPMIKYEVLSGSSAHKFDSVLALKSDVYIDTYYGFIRMLCDVKEDTRKRSKKKNRFVPNAGRVRKIAKVLQGAILDESTYIGNKTKLPFRIINKVTKDMPCCFELTATPFGRNPEKMWSQLFLVDHGYSLGETLGLFRAAFYNQRQNSWGGVEYKYNARMDETLHRFIKHCSIVYEAHEGDLPKVVTMQRYTVLDSSTNDYYIKARTALFKSSGFEETKNAFLRMRQISAGFLGYNNDDTGTKASYVFPENPKLDLLQESLEQMSPKYKAIVFHEFRQSGKLICERLRSMGIGYVELNGGTKNTDVVLRRFKDEPKVRVLVLSNSAGGYGLNLQAARYGFYYEAPVSPIIRYQTMKRFWRQYSEHESVFVVDLIVRDTVDEDILVFHKEGADLWQAILQKGAAAAMQKLA